MTEKNVLDSLLRIVKEYNAPVEKVYQAWTQADQMKQWMGPGTVTCESVDIDLRVGGKYSIVMVTDDCEHPNAIGEYKEIIPNQKLVFTWSWKGGDMPDTLVTVEFESIAEGTRLTLLHENFPAREASEKHTEGWTGCLSGLKDFLN